MADRKKARRKKRKQTAGRQAARNKAAMIGISAVVTMLLAVLFVQGQTLQRRIRQNEQKQEQLLAETEKEQERTGQIEDMEEYMQSDEYIEKIAREKIGLVKDNEIIFKEVK